jgi:hypothetical protein
VQLSVSEPSVIYRDEGNYVVVWENVLIHVRTGDLTLAALDAIEPAVHLARAQMKPPYGALGVQEPSAEMPSPDVRKRQRALFEGMLTAKGTFVVLVVLGDGVGAIARRTVFRTLLFRRKEVAVFDDVASAASWLAERVVVAPKTLEGAVAMAREAATSRGS